MVVKKSVFNFKIQYQDGAVIDLNDDKGLWVSSFRIPSVTPEHITETVDGADGALYIETRLTERMLKAVISFESLDIVDFDLFRDEIYRIFSPLKKFYIIRDLQPNKRITASVASGFDIDYLTLEDGEFEIEFVIHSTFIESAGTTLNPSPGDYYFPIDKRKIDAGDPPVKYIFNENSFAVFNDSAVTVNPRKQNMELKIIIKGTINNPIVRNVTTGEAWSWTGTADPSDEVILDGIKSLKNNISIFGQTNRKLLTLKPGWNYFEITGASDFTISFDFRFYYL